MQRMTQLVLISDLIYPGLNNITMQSYKSIDKTKSFESIIEKMADFGKPDDLDQLLEVAKSAHRACFEAGASKVVTIIKIADALEGTSIEGKVGKYRKVDS